MSIHKLRQLFARVGAFIHVRKTPNFLKKIRILQIIRNKLKINLKFLKLTVRVIFIITGIQRFTFINV